MGRTEQQRGTGQRRRWILRLAAVGIIVFDLGAWSLAGAPPAAGAGSPTCASRVSARTQDYLTGEVCPPEGFAVLLGYEPRLVRTALGYRYVKPAAAGGSCSGPLTERGPFWSFGDACAMHDYGYDLVRFGVGERPEADAQFYEDMLASCDARGLGRLACRALAKTASATLRLGDANGFDPEPIDR